MSDFIQFPQKLLDNLKNAFKELNELLIENGLEDFSFKNIEKVYSDYGWFIPYDIKIRQGYEVLIMFRNNEVDNANDFLINYFKNEIEDIEIELVNLYPERKNVISEAFRAHKEGMYFASTTLFLSQADGITNNKILFGPEFRKFKSKNKQHSLVNIFDNDNPLTVYFRKNSHSEVYNSELNRHGVMHGMSLDFGTELNSFKAISLLIFVSNFRNKIDDKV